jgi:PAS domain S-box-containing protein
LIEHGFYSGEQCYIHKNDQRRWWRIDAVKLSDTRFMGFAHDITNKKLMEDELQESERRLKNAEKTACIGHVEWNCVEQKAYWSDVIYDLFERDPLCGEPCYDEILDLYIPEDAKRLEEAVDRAIHHGEPYSLDLKLLLPSGSVAFHHVIGKPYVNDMGQVEKIIGTVQDVTERKNAEINFYTNERKYKTIVEHANDGIALLDSTGVITDVNQKAEDIFGGSKDELIGQKFSQLSIIPENELSMVNTQFKNFLHGENTVNDLWLTNKKGERLCIEGTGSVFENESHEKRIVVIVRDKTEKKKNEDEIKEKNLFLKTIMNESPFAMWVSDNKGTVIRTNKALCKLLNLSDNQIIGKYNVFNDQNLIEQDVMHLIKRVFSQKTPQRFVIPWHASKADGVDFTGGNNLWIDVTLFPILNDDHSS